MDKMNNRDINLLPKFKFAFAEKDWNELLNLLNPKMFKPFDSKYDLSNNMIYNIIINNSCTISITTIEKFQGIGCFTNFSKNSTNSYNRKF